MDKTKIECCEEDRRSGREAKREELEIRRPRVTSLRTVRPFSAFHVFPASYLV